ncbi:MAG TPA: DUF3309 family protein [Gammaproteobacteria bacterium]|nr:DUF3309 family protein [Gammaproteobacteria bacterium]
MTLGVFLLIVLSVMLVGTMPRWSYSKEWGYGSCSLLGIVLIVVVVLLLAGRL